MKIINASIDLTKVDKSRIVNHSNGSKYLNVTIFVNEEKNQYDQDTSIAHSQTKEESEAKAKRTYIGNGKTVFDSSTPKQEKEAVKSPENKSSESDTGLPF